MLLSVSLTSTDYQVCPKDYLFLVGVSVITRLPFFRSFFRCLLLTACICPSVLIRELRSVVSICCAEANCCCSVALVLSPELNMLSKFLFDWPALGLSLRDDDDDCMGVAGTGVAAMCRDSADFSRDWPRRMCL